MPFVRDFAPIALVFLLGSCSALSVFDGPRHEHISLANLSGYNVTVAPGGQKLLVSLDTSSAVQKRMVWAASFGMAEGPATSEFDRAASDWLKFERPECKASNGQRTSFSSFEYDLTCPAADTAR